MSFERSHELWLWSNFRVDELLEREGGVEDPAGWADDAGGWAENPGGRADGLDGGSEGPGAA